VLNTSRMSPQLPRESCDIYLDAAVKATNQTISRDGNPMTSIVLADKLKQTSGVLILLVDVLEKENSGRGSWLTKEAIASIRRLADR
jgi:hypothetical protein